MWCVNPLLILRSQLVYAALIAAIKIIQFFLLASPRSSENDRKKDGIVRDALADRIQFLRAMRNAAGGSLIKKQ